MCALRRLKSYCASAQSDKNLCCPHEENLHLILSKMRPVKILIRLRECAVWSESFVGAHVRRLHARAIWSESSLSTWRNFAYFSIQNALSKDSDQIAWMIWIFAGRTYPKVRFLSFGSNKRVNFEEGLTLKWWNMRSNYFLLEQIPFQKWLVYLSKVTKIVSFIRNGGEPNRCIAARLTRYLNRFSLCHSLG